MRDIMLDLETLGLTPGCIVFAIGAVPFDVERGELGAPFFELIQPESARVFGLESDPDAVDWWGKQTPDARRYLDAAHTDGLTLPVVLQRFSDFLAANGRPDELHVWGKGADFDPPILAAAYRQVAIPLPWGARSARCYRTLEALSPVPVPRHTLTGVAHHAVDDAIHQAQQAITILRQLKGLAPRAPQASEDFTQERSWIGNPINPLPTTPAPRRRGPGAA